MSTIIIKMHRVDYSVGTPQSAGSEASEYMLELTDKLSLVREEILGPTWKMGDLVKEWYVVGF